MKKTIEWSGKEYRIPVIPYIARLKETEKLYRLEDKMKQTVRAAAEELGRLMEHEEDELWTHTMPEELASILDGFEPGISIAVAIGYLLKKGFTITKEEKQGD